jgi:sugar O-acyltransferase (sialic acid O-acetyltransferase NeuD family)
MREKIIIIGGGGQCKSCIEVIEVQGRFKISGIVDIKNRVGQKVNGYEIIGADDDLPDLFKRFQTKNVLIALGRPKTLSLRKQLFDRLKTIGAECPTIISPTAIVSQRARIGIGTIVMHHSVVNAGAQIGDNVIINTAAIIEHDAMVGDHCHISTGSIINGNSKVGQESFLGSNSVVIDEREIASRVIIGAGAVVIQSIYEAGTYVGNPARSSEVIEQ